MSADNPAANCPKSWAISSECGVTVLRATKDYKATKRFSWNAKAGHWQKISYEAGAWFHPAEHTVTDLQQLVAVLDKARADPAAFVVRGELAPWAREQIADRPLSTIRRRKHKKNNVEPPLVETARRWLMIDIDDWPLPPSADLVDDPESAIDTAIHELLPEQFHDAECWWQLSSSAGFSAGVLKCHLFFWLSEPATNLHIKTVLKQHAPGVDRAPFSAAQPHYIADPIIEGGHDPIPRRTGWRKGLEQVVILPAVIVAPMPAQSRVLPPRGKGGALASAIAILGHGEGRDGFHAPIRSAVLAYARQAARLDNRDDDAFKSWLREQIRSAPCRPGSNVENPYCQDFYLQSSIDGAFALLSGDSDIQTMKPHHNPVFNSADEARASLTEHISGFFKNAFDWHQLVPELRAEQPPQHAGIVITTGGGKTTQALAEIKGFISKAKAAGLPHRVLWLVPHHKLGAETLTRMTDLGLNVAGLYGRDAIVPGQPLTFDNIQGEDTQPQKMCLNLPAAGDAVSIGADVERAVCGSGKAGEPACPFRSDCHYQKQKPIVAAADVIVAAHNSLYHQLPKIVSKGLALIVIDESFWQGGLRPNIPTRLASFAEEPTMQPVLKRKVKGDTRRPAPDFEATNDLHALAAKAQRGFESIPDGELVSRKAMHDAGLTALDCIEAGKLEWQRKVEGVLHPGQSPDARKAAIKDALGNSAIPRRAGIWHALQELLVGEETHTGRLQMSSKPDADGGAARMILLHSRAEIRPEITALPVLHLDATMPLDVVRYFLPRLDVLANLQASAPNMTVHQITGGFGKTTLIPSDRASPEENRARLKTLGELRDFVRLNSGGDALVVTYQAIEAHFAGDGIRTGHFNALAGLDCYADVRSLFVIGRPLPDALELRASALALTGRPIAPETGRRETRGALMADGTGAAVNVRAYADPDLEALRVAITEAEVIQAIGRGRGMNRTPDKPLTVFIMADVALPLALTRLAAWNSVCPDAVARMAARGVLLTSPTDAARAYPDLFPSTEAAKKTLARAFQGRELGDISLWISYHRGLSPNSATKVTYRPAGRGQKTSIAWAASERLPELRTWLEKVCGCDLAHFEVRQPDAPEPPQPPARPPQPDIVLNHPPAFATRQKEAVMPTHNEPEPVLFDELLNPGVAAFGVWTIKRDGRPPLTLVEDGRRRLRVAITDPIPGAVLAGLGGGWSLHGVPH